MSNCEVEEVLLCLGAFKKSYKKGETILEQGSITHEMGLILSGAVIIESCDMWGNNTVLGVNGEGDVFAEAYACAENEVLRVSVRAIKNSEILFFSASKLFSGNACRCSHGTELIKNLLSVCALKSLRLSERIINTSSKTLRGKIMSFLSGCADREGSNTFLIPFDRQQLADYLCADRSALSNELSKMKREGLIIFKKNKFRILKNNAL